MRILFDNQTLINVFRFLFIIILISTILPNPHKYFPDTLLLVISLFFFFKYLSVHVFFYGFITLIFFIFPKIIFTDFNLISLEAFLSDFRFFLISGLLISYFKIMNKNGNYIYLKNDFFILIIITTFIVVSNIIAKFNYDFYSMLQDLWNDDSRKIERWGNKTVAVRSGRQASIFPHPATHGYVSIAILIFTLSTIFRYKLNFILSFLIILIVFYSSLLSQSKFFYAFIFSVIPAYYFAEFLVEKVKNDFLSFLIIIFMGLISFFFLKYFLSVAFNFNLFSIITGNRFHETKYIFNALSVMNWSNIFYGYNHTPFPYPGRAWFGDSGYTMKLFQGGIFYLFIFYYFAFKALITISDSINIEKKYSYLVFMILLIGELGFTSFSLPQASMLFFSIIYISFKYLTSKKNNEN